MLKLENRSKGRADINLFDGRRVVILPGRHVVLQGKWNREIDSFYRPLRRFDIFLVSEPDEEDIKLAEQAAIDSVPVNPETPVNPEGDKVPEVIIPDEADLKKMNHAQLLEIAKSIDSEVDEKLSKKELTEKILGGK